MYISRRPQPQKVDGAQIKSSRVHKFNYVFQNINDHFRLFVQFPDIHFVN